MKIAIVVQGRFHAFDLARALIERGNDVTVFTNYPYWAVERFGLPKQRVRTFPLHGVFARLAGRIQTKTGWCLEPWTHPMFSRWAASQLREESWDVIHAWTGVAEEIYRDPAIKAASRLVMRGSAHIKTQAAILGDESHRVGLPIDQPSKWMIEREQREYELADEIIVLSTFARSSFRDQGIHDSKLRFLPLGADTRKFRPTAATIAQRRDRIRSGAPLRVLYVGNVSFQKGIADFCSIIEQAPIDRFRFRFVGAVTPEAREIVSRLSTRADFAGKIPQAELPLEYARNDLFLFPTIQDGFAAVLAQASASALPILTTENCCGPDLVKEGRTGWVLPIRSPGAFADRLQWCDAHRPELADMITAIYSEFRTRDWSDVAADFEAIVSQDAIDRQDCLSGSAAGVSGRR